MSLLPEFILQSTIVRGIRTLRNDARFVDQLFRNLDQKSLEQIRQFIRTQVIDLAMNYPREPLKVPAIVLLLKSETEANAFLGDTMGLEVPDVFGYDDPDDGAVLGGAASVSSMDGNPKLVFGPFPALTGTENTLRISTNEWDNDQWIDSNYKIRLVSGTGKGQIRGISANGRNSLMTDTPWTVIPDHTTKFEITLPPDETFGQPSSLYNRQDPAQFIERRGSIYTLNYQIQVIGANPESTIYLSIILKSIFTLARLSLEKQGIINFKMSATDFLPRAEYQPDFSYMRALNMEFLFHFDVFEELTDELARTFDIALRKPEDDEIEIETVFSLDKNNNVIDDLGGVNRVYFGAANPPGSIDAAFVKNTLGTVGSALTTDRQRIIEFFSNQGQKMYYAYPQSYAGAPTDFIDLKSGLPAGFSIAATIPVTTTFKTEPFYVWVSDNPSFGESLIRIK